MTLDKAGMTTTVVDSVNCRKIVLRVVLVRHWP